MPEFLTLADIVEIHKDQIARYGGMTGVRDIALLTSALAMPETSFDGKLLHAGNFEIAAAYAFHLCQNHPFIDGNKRVALMAALVFLELNGIQIQDPAGELYRMMMGTANGRLGKPEIAEILRRLATGARTEGAPPQLPLP
ncbi:MAG: type II toxin-antitoxin system death-on-curing family toxin [Spirochaetes bacterium]|nr:MAG: type II toxin-antitoxin system death-on-curing family toxin [Spirochaetota bacterium]